jgi:hypothetical protein
VEKREEARQQLQQITVAFGTGRTHRNMAKTACVANSRCDEKSLKNIYLIESDHVIF